MSGQTSKVDVLGVLRKMRSNSYCWDFGQEGSAYAADQSAMADEAISAVAELIQKVDAYLDDSSLENRMDLIDARNRIGSES